jgi:hypothetical protein
MERDEVGEFGESTYRYLDHPVIIEKWEDMIRKGE